MYTIYQTSFADINTALMHICDYNVNCIVLVHLFMNHGVDINIQNNEGYNITYEKNVAMGSFD